MGSEAVAHRCSVKKLFLEISQNSQKSTCARVSFLTKLQARGPATILKKGLWHRCFPVNFVKFLKTAFLQYTSGRPFLPSIKYSTSRKMLLITDFYF